MNFSKTIIISFLIFFAFIAIATGIYSLTTVSADELEINNIIPASWWEDYDIFIEKANSGYLQVTVTN